MNREKLVERVDAVKPGSYDASYTDMLAFRECCDGSGELFRMAFNYGFLKGQRAAKAEAKRKGASR